MLKNLNLFWKKLTLLDKALLLFIVLFGVMFFFFFYRKGEFISIRVKVTNQDVLNPIAEPQNWYANRFEVGDVELDALGKINTELIGVERFNISSKTQAVYLDLRIKAVYDSRTKLYSARGKTLVFGTPLRFYLSKVTFDGLVTEFPGSESQRDLKIGKTQVVTLGRNVEPAIAAAVKIGDKIYDSNGVLLAEVTHVDVRPAEEVTTTDQGNLLLRYNPLYKDLIVTITVRTKNTNGETFVFDNLPLKVGEVLPLNFEHVSIFPLITSVLNV